MDIVSQNIKLNEAYMRKLSLDMQLISTLFKPKKCKECGVAAQGVKMISDSCEIRFYRDL